MREGAASPATTFPVAMVAWSVGLFALLRSPWVEGRVLLPLAGLQKQAADHFGGAPRVPVAVTLECSGADVLALGIAAVLAWPASWASRLAGALGVVAFVLALNTVRIATLGHAASSPGLFRVLHLEVWPGVLVLATAGYVFCWMRERLAAPSRDTGLAVLARRFAPRAALLLVIYVLAAPWIAQSTVLASAGAWTAAAAASTFAATGLAASAAGNVLVTTRGAFRVTPECLATPLVPLYAAAILAAPWGWRRRGGALAAGLPLFALLGITRLLVLALPPVLVASPLVVVHAFHQLAFAVVAIAALAWWHEVAGPGRVRRATLRTGRALGAAVVVGMAAHVLLTALLRSFVPHGLVILSSTLDAQGALAVLPGYQAGLLIALAVAGSVGWRRVLASWGVLLLSQVLLFVALSELAAHAGLAVHALVVRAWAVGLPMGLTWLSLRAERDAVPHAPGVPADGHR